MELIFLITIFSCFYWHFYYMENQKSSTCIFGALDLLEEIQGISENKIHFLDIIYDTSIKGYILVLYNREESPIVIRLFFAYYYSIDSIRNEANFEEQKKKIINMLIRELKQRLENYRQYEPYHYSDFYKSCPIDELKKIIKERKLPF